MKGRTCQTCERFIRSQGIANHRAMHRRRGDLVVMSDLRYTYTADYRPRAVHWCPSGRPLDGVPGEVTVLLATGRTTHGYGYGPGWSMIFGYPRGEVQVEPGQWVVRHHDGTVTVEAELPAGAVVFDAQAVLARWRREDSAGG